MCQLGVLSSGDLSEAGLELTPIDVQTSLFTSNCMFVSLFLKKVNSIGHMGMQWEVYTVCVLWFCVVCQKKTFNLLSSILFSVSDNVCVPFVDQCRNRYTPRQINDLTYK